ncbi:sigma-54-dependent Fis family transcriptional regulator [Myxococcus llanfairpwllgwyngyllgogerychwyrndrobwllllantysiliogogogochensis]|uniref:Sigma-54-dependent Fis family transcriptional regulator n=1 Tax=Myxococcus llanfairpwllgwyngyllgogerychwyrndrobwllllantysiliogogogochensis TaxID=2590453 RepID=A0A540X6K0_9BACT|nr:sigma-54-dependent Fis family transcriptional regulator [Myxococcus llanfairpwllgwyngyllgogerychwyrndrobwllllantysiliogogogochensis]TQF16893.1 sigma-54-dependent Fis family transcriptional regulator [Myxococcus llanfairpwllgwyngyllgogerychwyrndrobwllllantysiliogogogochensis]
MLTDMVTLEARFARERDLYLAVLRVLDAPSPLQPLQDVLTCLVELADAQRAGLELYGESSVARREWSLFHGCSELEREEIRALTSRGIVASTIAAGKSVHTAHALLDARFASSASVKAQRLEAVLCVPLGGRLPGVLYLEGKRGAGPFSEGLVQLAESVAHFLGTASERALLQRGGDKEDPTRPFRERFQLEDIIGRSPGLAHVFAQLAVAAPLDVTVMIGGPSGTGKTQLAQALHVNSKRRLGPFVELNCAAVPEGLFESEFFGAFPGAFPGARRTVGKVEAAEGGTLFLDEIAEIPLAAQAKLLQLLQSRQYFPLASPKAFKANVRLVAASNANLEQLVRERRFREDLFYRLNVLSVRMPALAERREDIVPLVEALVERLAEENGLPRLRPSPACFAACELAEWPGNVRQLRHRLEAALIRASAEAASFLEPRHLFEGMEAQGMAPVSFHEATRRFQRDLLRRELDATDWCVSDVAQRLDLTRQHIYNLMKAFGLTRDSQTPES